MLKLSAKLKTIPFTFEEIDGKQHELEIREYTVQDVKKLMDLQSTLVGDNKLTLLEQSEIIVVSRIVCAVKVKGTNDHYWGTVEALTDAGYPNGLLDAIYPKVNELNPINSGKDETMGEKKSES